MNCFKCGRDIPDDCVFCPTCGEDLSREGKVPCPKCATYSEKDYIYCPKCGERMDGKHICSKCQTELPDGSNFCPKCGDSAILSAPVAYRNSTIRKSFNALAANGNMIRMIVCAILSVVVFFLMFAPVVQMSTAQLPSEIVPFEIKINMTPIQVMEAGFSGEIEDNDFMEEIKTILLKEISPDTFLALSSGNPLSKAQQSEVEAAFSKINILKAYSLTSVAPYFKSVKVYLTISAVIALLLILAPLVTLLFAVLGIIRKRKFKHDIAGLVASFCLWILLLFAIRLCDYSAGAGGGLIAVMIILSIGFLGLFAREFFTTTGSKLTHLGAIRNTSVAVIAIVLVAALSFSNANLVFKSDSAKKYIPTYSVSTSVFIPLYNLFLNNEITPSPDNDAKAICQDAFNDYQSGRLTAKQFKDRITTCLPAILFRHSLVYETPEFYYVSAAIPYTTLASGIFLMLAAYLLLASVLAGEYKRKLFSTIVIGLSALSVVATAALISAASSLFGRLGDSSFYLVLKLSGTPIVAIILIALIGLAGLFIPAKNSTNIEPLI